MVKLTLIRGLPGSGKSTLANTIDAVHLEADMYFVNQQGEYCYQPDKIAQAHQWCQQQTEQQLALGHDVVVANTFVQQWEMQAYRDLANKYQAELEIVCCNGQYSNVHGVSALTIANMRAKWQD
ncbi:ATP-binding protein [Agarivorans sp. TSD2052]|uniref:AAA family ATPase n=1 Tax=Agarivorans sp. TSD2052 TaxID=2937286 RepID=UPI00200C4F41|nr:AAA family ATPase [Agarivorans sp. TSD2052]UPW20101.1 ATP-binding protein [Agarivorans sp. TSD2052]